MASSWLALLACAGKAFVMCPQTTDKSGEAPQNETHAHEPPSARARTEMMRRLDGLAQGACRLSRVGARRVAAGQQSGTGTGTSVGGTATGTTAAAAAAPRA